MYVVTKDGYKLPVDTTGLPTDRRILRHESVAMLRNSTELEDVWILQLQNNTMPPGHKPNLELIQELIYDHKPAKEEILWAMSAYNVEIYGIATIVKGYRIKL